jgi:anti-sigma factor RsiW
MGLHEEFLELCAAATAGELSPKERARLNAHLTECLDCLRAMEEYEFVRTNGVPFLAPELARSEERADDSWSVEDAEREFFKKVDREHEAGPAVEPARSGQLNAGQRFTYRPSQIRWREVWMPFAAAILLAVALGIASYRAGVKRGTDVASTFSQSAKEAASPLEAQASDVGYERAQLTAKLAENAKIIDDLKRRLAEETKAVEALKSADVAAARSTESSQRVGQSGNDGSTGRDVEIAVTQRTRGDLQKTLDAATIEREEAVSNAAVLEAKISELTKLMRERDRALEQNEVEVAKQQELLEHDRDIRELMGARDLYMADVHDVTRAGTDKTYGRVFYTKGKTLIFYAFDLDARPGLQNASSFQAWGRRGPDKQQALSLGIFYEDNVSKKRWVLKANDPKTLQDIDAVFVTVEPNGGSHHPSGKQLLFAYLRVNPNHP